MEQLPVMEHFYTIQGEGFHQGKAAYFVRLAGCDVGCPWCDVKESWDKDAHPVLSVQTIVDFVVGSGAKICVITGGEPLMHNLDGLTELLLQNNIGTHIETSGAHPMSGKWNWVCLSPKRYKLPLDECLKAAHELKVVISHRNDFRFAEQYTAQVNNTCKLYMQPEWDKREEVTPIMIDYVKQHQEWILSLQIHKYIHVP
jgi:organic radical activating enzyme